MTLAAVRRARCPRCERPVVDCLCPWIVPIANDVPVLVLQHPREARQAKGSTRLLALSLARCRVEVGERFDAAVLGGVPSWLLYPAYPALPRSLADAPPPAAPAADHQLVVLDATWRKSRRMLFEHPWLATLPRCSLTELPASRYAAIRRAEAADQRSTLEATCLALQQLEDAAPRYAPLLQAFEGFVAQQQRWRATPGVPCSVRG